MLPLMIPSLLNGALPARLIALSTPAAVRGWTVGQLLSATVMKVDGAAGTAMLQIGERRVQAQVSGPMNPGQRLELRVLETGARTLLERLPAPQENAMRVQQQALRERLPQAVPMRDLLPALERAAQRADAVAAPAANTRAAAATQAIVNVLPAFKDLAQPEALKRAMQASGLFLESNLARATDADLRQLLPRDLKVSLLRLVQAVSPGAAPPPSAPAADAATSRHAELQTRAAPVRAEPRQVALPPPALEDGPPAHPRIAEQARGGIAAIEVNQLRAIAETGQGSAIWTMDLPVRDPAGELRYLRLEVEEESIPRQGEMHRQWSMTVRMDIEPLGPMCARVTLIEDSVHTVIWSERPATAELARLHAEWLRTQMRQAGLEPAEVQCLQGQPVPRAAAAPTPLVDTHA